MEILNCLQNFILWMYYWLSSPYPKCLDLRLFLGGGVWIIYIIIAWRWNKHQIIYVPHTPYAHLCNTNNSVPKTKFLSVKFHLWCHISTQNVLDCGAFQISDLGLECSMCTKSTRKNNATKFPGLNTKALVNGRVLEWLPKGPQDFKMCSFWAISTFYQLIK
jgi:hypothetical protein